MVTAFLSCMLLWYLDSSVILLDVLAVCKYDTSQISGMG